MAGSSSSFLKTGKRRRSAASSIRNAPRYAELRTVCASCFCRCWCCHWCSSIIWMWYTRTRRFFSAVSLSSARQSIFTPSPGSILWIYITYIYTSTSASSYRPSSFITPAVWLKIWKRGWNTPSRRCSPTTIRSANQVLGWRPNRTSTLRHRVGNLSVWYGSDTKLFSVLSIGPTVCSVF